MQEIKRQKAPPVRTPSFMDVERQRIYSESDARRRPEIEPEAIEDPEDPRFFMGDEELQTFYKEKLERESKETQQDHRAATMKRIYEKTEPPKPAEAEEDPYDGRPPVQQAIDGFLEKNPRFTNPLEWKPFQKTAETSMHNDVYLLREKFKESESAGDCAAWLERSAEIVEVEKKEAERRAAVEKMAEDRFPIKFR